VILAIILVVFVVALILVLGVLWSVLAWQMSRVVDPEVAPLESSGPRERVRATMDRPRSDH
jgi:hypothetical protein